MTHGTEFHGRGGAPAHPGRHRLGGTESWTPPLPPNRAGRRHAAGHAPVDPPVSGSLPLAPPRPGGVPLPQPMSGSFARSGPLPRPASFERPVSGTLPDHVSGSLPFEQPVSGTLTPPSLPQPRDRRPAPPLFPAAHGDLPLDDDLEPVAESRADQAARRTRVSLASPQPRHVEPEDDDVRIYAAPPLDGLGGFTIGSVPASVTPPKTWKKAAWFATGASGAVVVGLLFAGSYLVGKPPVDQAVQGAWPGYQGAPTVIDPTGEAAPTSREGGSAAGPDTSSRPDQPAGRTSGGGAGPVDGAVPPPADDSSAVPGTTGTATPSARPQKPPVTPAQRETPVKPPWWYSFPPDAQTMGDNTEKFFNTVTTDPAAAAAVTTGELHDQGPQALAERYAGIAYFEVRKISIDQQRGVTVNTVEITHTDGSKTIENRTLTFGDGDKIAADGQ
ncbi:hypothetical protein AB0J40_36035 [Amycolatopsis sp. NPDC049691]|uniref:hypothetical protein n=1 Tax=Amycolatopsis sp. NPDC049691 TaxID=3155155 RepID=UPI00341CF1A5